MSDKGLSVEEKEAVAAPAAAEEEEPASLEVSLDGELEEEVSTICPACRNQTTAREFCEYCGTLLQELRPEPLFTPYEDGQVISWEDAEWTLQSVVLWQKHRIIWEAVDADHNRLTIVETTADFHNKQAERFDTLSEEVRKKLALPDDVQEEENRVRLFYRRRLKWCLRDLIVKRSLKFGSYVMKAIMASLFDVLQPLYKDDWVVLDLVSDLIDVDEELEHAQLIIPSLFREDDPHPELPNYVGLSPREVAVPGSGKLTVSSGLYMVGMLLYYLIARQEPFKNDAPINGALPNPRLLNPTFPLGIFRVLAKALRLRRGKRYKKLTRFVKEYEKALEVVESRKRQKYQPVPVSFGYEKHIGIYKKLLNPVNQDELLCAYHGGARKGFFMICDGVSTSTFGRGDEASLITIREGYLKWQAFTQDPNFNKPTTVDQRRQLIRDVYRESNRTICQTLNNKYGPFTEPNPETMATTGLMAVVDGNRLTLGTLGDSRAYIITKRFIEQINFDHNLGNHHLLHNRLFFKHPQLVSAGKALTRCVGTFMVNEEGMLTPRLTEPDFISFNLLPGERVLLCSDGVTDYVGNGGPGDVERVLFEEVNAHEHPNETCFELIIRANRGGGGDNISCILIVCD